MSDHIQRRNKQRAYQRSRGLNATALVRKQACWVFPFLFVSLALFLRGLAPGVGKVLIAGAVASVVPGIALRRQREARVVILVWCVTSAFLLLFLLGILAPLAYLTLLGQHELVPWCGAVGAVLFCVFTGARTRVALRRDFQPSLEAAPGVTVGTEGVLQHEVVPYESSVVTPLASMALVLLPLAMIVSHGTPYYLATVLGLGPVVIALLCVDPVARVVALYLAVRRWEREHGKRLRLPPL